MFSNTSKLRKELKRDICDLHKVEALFKEGANPLEHGDLTVAPLTIAFQNNHVTAADILMQYCHDEELKIPQWVYNGCLNQITYENCIDFTRLLTTHCQDGELSSDLNCDFIADLIDKDEFSLFKKIIQKFSSPELYLNHELLLVYTMKVEDKKYFRHLLCLSNIDLNAKIDRVHSKDKTASFLKYIATEPEFLDHLKILLTELRVNTDTVEEIMKHARHAGNSAAENVVHDHYNSSKWSYNRNNPRQITRYIPNATPEHSLMETFNFKSKNTGERISVFRNLKTDQESVSRNEFINIDPIDVNDAFQAIKKANGGRIPFAEHQSTVIPPTILRRK